MQKILIMGCFLFSLLVPQVATTCTVPIYQYALENWTADDYRILVFQDQVTDSETKAALRQLETAANDSLVNLSLEYHAAADLDTTAFAHKISFPWMFVFFPEISRNPQPFWQGPVTAENVRRLINSPMRRKLVQRIAAGDAAVWLLLETGENSIDSSRSHILKKYLEIFSKELKVAAVSVDSLGNRVSHPDSAQISVQFSMLSLKPDAPDELIFRRMLLGFEPDLFLLDQPFRQPVAVPVFGRGRALYSLIGPGINEKMIRRACESIIGWCSCEVKAENPGMDLLVKANWQSFIPQLPSPEMPALTGLSRFLPAPSEKSFESPPADSLADSVFIAEETDTVFRDTIATEAATPVSSGPLWQSLLWLFLVIIIVLIGATFFILKNKRFE